MGYTHYWNREKELNAEQFQAVVEDIKRIVPVLSKYGI